MRYRSRTDIISKILDAANGGAKKTKITYMAFLSYNQLKEYRTILTESHLLSYDANAQIFKTTEKGLRFLQSCNQMSDVIKTQEED